MREFIKELPNETIDFLKTKEEFIIEEFFDKNIIGRSIEVNDTTTIKKVYRNILENLCYGNLDDYFAKYIELTAVYIRLGIPYITLLNELSHLEHTIMEILISYGKTEDVVIIYKISKVTENVIAKEYLKVYIEKLISMSNNRLSSLGDMVEKFVVVHYADHLKWLINLANSLRTPELTMFPETDKTLCSFGKWLIGDAKNIIKNNSKLKELDRVHSQLHYVAQQIKHVMGNDKTGYDYDVVLTYLEKAELLSLSIGTELALIDNTIINQKATKDTLTGALGRQVLSQLFQNQYELSLATNQKFILAMCDLDHFKKINDTYGHIAGDKMLQSFVNVVKETLRNSDIVIRYGGEEFVFILPAISKEKAYLVLDKIRVSFEEFTLTFNKQKINTTVSMGMLEIEPESGYSIALIDEFIDLVDNKLYKAKQNGRNCII